MVCENPQKKGTSNDHHWPDSADVQTMGFATDGAGKGVVVMNRNQHGQSCSRVWGCGGHLNFIYFEDFHKP